MNIPAILLLYGIVYYIFNMTSRELYILVFYLTIFGESFLSAADGATKHLSAGIISNDNIFSRGRRCGATDNTTAVVARVAVAFFGMSRNLAATLPSIEHHVFKVLDANDILYDVFWHTMVSTTVQSARKGEKEYGFIDPFDLQRMRPCKFSITDQDSTKSIEFYKFMKARGASTEDALAKYDVWRDKLVSVKTMLCALFTQHSLKDMIHAHMSLHHIHYDAIIALRPDTAIIKDIDLPWYISDIRQQPNWIWFPSFQHWGGLNDRAAFGSVHAMRFYLNRGVAYRDADQSLRGEQIVKHMVEVSNLSARFSDMRVVRVRQDGKVSIKDTPSAMNISVDPIDVDYQRCVPNLKTRDVSPLC